MADLDPTSPADEPTAASEQVHELKVWPSFFEALRSGAKTFEVRRDDRNYMVGDRLQGREFGPDGYTGRCTFVYRITYVLRAADLRQLGVDIFPSDTVILGLKK